MADALQPNRWRTITTTPLRDVVRGRLTGRLDWPGRVAAAGLPADVAGLIVRVVRRTRLWRLERAAVADELVAHFADAIAAGAVDPVAAFGDERAAATLIRRAKRRGRSMVSHAWTWAWRGLAVTVALYAVTLVRFVVGRPTPRVDYVAVIAAPARAVPADERAWPLWESAFDACTVAWVNGGRDLPEVIDPPDDKRVEPAAARAWLAGHAEAIATARRAAARLRLGYVVGPGGPYHVEGARPDEFDGMVIGIPLPHLHSLRSVGVVLSADAADAAAAGDGGRVESDLLALHGAARQLRGSDTFVVTELVALAIDRMAVERLGRVVADHPGVLDDAALVRLAHTFAGPQVAADLLDLSGERVAYADDMQHVYTDDGHGDGRLARASLRPLAFICAVSGSQRFGGDGRAGWDAARWVPFAVASRSTVTVLHEQLLAEASANLSRPRRSVDWSAYDGQVRAWWESAVDRVRYMALLPLVPSVRPSQETAERYLGLRDGLEVGIALEAYRRGHGGRYPGTLAELVPGLLPAVPADRITGDPVRYRLAAGRPVVYSVGADRRDDGGRRPTDPYRSAATWDGGQVTAGDWVLYPPAAND